MNDHERDPDLAKLAERLGRERPVPRAAFRGDLRRRLITARTARTRPQRLWAWVTAYASGGTALLLVAGLGLAGTGPFAA